MTENTTYSIVSDDPLDDKPIWFPARPKITWSKPTKFSPDKDIELWLKHNAPLTFQQLADIRYSLYHQCSRADFTVAKAFTDQFDLIGRHSKLRVISDRARHYLLWRLRRLGRKRKWINALPRTKKRRRPKEKDCSPVAEVVSRAGSLE
jgi:hypothetical protein